MFSFFKKKPRACERCGIVSDTVQEDPYRSSFAFFCGDCREKREIVANLSRPIIDAFLRVQEVFPESFYTYNQDTENLKPFLSFDFGYRDGKDERDENFTITNRRKDIKMYKIEPSIMQAILTRKDNKTRFVFNNDEGFLIANKYINNEFKKKYELIDCEDLIRFLQIQVESFVYEQ